MRRAKKLFTFPKAAAKTAIRSLSNARTNLVVLDELCAALEAVVLNKAMSLVVVASALPFRATTVPIAQAIDHWPVILNLLVPIVIYALAAVLLAIIGNVLMPDTRNNLPEWVTWYLPWFYFNKIVSHSEDSSSFSRVYMPGDQSVSRADFVQYTFIVGVGYILAAALVIWHTIRRFDKIVGRARQG